MITYSSRTAALEQALFYADRALKGSIPIFDAVFHIQDECLPLYDLTKDELNSTGSKYLVIILENYYLNIEATFSPSEPLSDEISNEELKALTAKRVTDLFTLWRMCY